MKKVKLSNASTLGKNGLKMDYHLTPASLKYYRHFYVNMFNKERMQYIAYLCVYKICIVYMYI